MTSPRCSGAAPRPHTSRIFGTYASNFRVKIYHFETKLMALCKVSKYLLIYATLTSKTNKITASKRQYLAALGPPEPPGIKGTFPWY